MKKLILVFLCLGLVWYINAHAATDETTKNTDKSRFIINKIELTMNTDENFTGRAIFYLPQHKAVFEINNIRKMPFDFKNALFCAVTSPPNKAVYQLEFEKIYNKKYQQLSFISNPRDTIAIQCIAPNNLVYISGAYIKLNGGRKIYFEYEELSSWQKFYRDLLKTMGFKKKSNISVSKDKEGWKTGVTSSGARFRYREVDKQEKKEWWEEQ